MMLATPDRADQQRDRAQPEEQGIQGALGLGLGGERAADGCDGLGFSGLASSLERLSTCVGWLVQVVSQSCGR